MTKTALEIASGGSVGRDFSTQAIQLTGVFNIVVNLSLFTIVANCPPDRNRKASLMDEPRCLFRASSWLTSNLITRVVADAKQHKNYKYSLRPRLSSVAAPSGLVVYGFQTFLTSADFFGSQRPGTKSFACHLFPSSHFYYASLPDLLLPVAFFHIERNDIAVSLHCFHLDMLFRFKTNRGECFKIRIRTCSFNTRGFSKT